MTLWNKTQLYALNRKPPQRVKVLGYFMVEVLSFRLLETLRDKSSGDDTLISPQLLKTYFTAQIDTRQ